MTPEVALILGIDGLANGAVYLLAGLGLVLIFSVTRVVFVPFGDVAAFAALSLAAFAGTFLGVLLMSFGAKYAKAGVAAALTSTYPVWIVPIAKFILKERVSWQSAVCTALAVGGIILMVV